MSRWERVTDVFARAIVELVAIVGLAMIITIIMCGIARAAECTETSVIRLGQTAMCEGRLVPYSWARDCVRCTDEQLPRAQVDCDLRVALVDAARREQESIALAQMTRAQTLAVEIERLRAVPVVSAPWYRSAWLWAPAGLVIGGLAGYGLHALR